MTKNYKSVLHSDENSGPVYLRSSVSSAQSRSSSSIHSETSSSRGSDYIFGSDNYGFFGAFPKLSRDKIVVNHEREHHNEWRRIEKLPVLQKTAMSAFLASPSPNRWSDLVRTMRVESRINGLGFASLHDDIDKMIDDCKRRNEHKEETSEGAREVDAVASHDVIGVENTLSNTTDATLSNTSSSSQSNSSTSSTCEDFSNPSDESFTFTATFPQDVFNEIEDSDLEDDLNEKGKVSFQVKVAMAQFMRNPSSHNAWSDLVDLCREEKTKEDGAWGECRKSSKEKLGKAEKMNSQDFYATVESGQDWANFDDIINKKQNSFVPYDVGFHQECAMKGFLEQPSQEKWAELVQSLREEKVRHAEVSCPSLKRLQRKLEKLEEEAFAVEKNWDKEVGTANVIIKSRSTQSKIDNADCFEEEINYSV